ncbi:MAG: arginine deiminase family protein [Cytophagales bacterium]|nr:arginine deiminase family protein [Cytophagales bacterium]
MISCHSEYGKIKSVYIKRAADAFVDDATLERDWKSLNFLGKPDFEKAKAEYAVFENVFRQEGIDIKHFPHDASLFIDSIYCRDASIATDEGMILCNMGKEARLREPQAQRKAFEEDGMKILGAIEPPGTVEGGDVAWLDQHTLAVGHTYRTNEAGIDQLTAMLWPLGVTVMRVPLPHYKGPGDVFHLMSILSPVDHNLAVVYSPLMPIFFRNELLRRGFELIEVPEAEFETMGCNVLAISTRNCIMVKSNPQTAAALRKAGCRITEYSGNEISVRGGGGPTCLTRPLQREW